MNNPPNFAPPPWAIQTTQSQVGPAPQAATTPQPMFPAQGLQAPQYAPPAPQNYGPPPQAPVAYAPPAGLSPRQIGLPEQDFNGVGDAKVFPKTPFFPIGNFVVQIDEVKAIRSQNPSSEGQPKVIIVGTVLESNVAGTVGTQFAQTINLARYGKPDLKAFVGAACGADPNRPEQLEALAGQGAFTPASMVQLCSAAQPLRGRKMRLTTHEKNLKGGGTPKNPRGVFTMHVWGPHTG